MYSDKRKKGDVMCNIMMCNVSDGPADEDVRGKMLEETMEMGDGDELG